MPRALITGITGQDGQHLAEFLHTKGYEVYGLVKGQNNPKVAALLAEFPFIRIVHGDLTDFSSLVAALRQVEPDEVYNLGAISFVQLSFKQAELTVYGAMMLLGIIEAALIKGVADTNLDLAIVVGGVLVVLVPWAFVHSGPAPHYDINRADWRMPRLALVHPLTPTRGRQILLRAVALYLGLAGLMLLWRVIEMASGA